MAQEIQGGEGGTAGSGLRTPPCEYLGKDVVKDLYYFVSIKDGMVRFLRFGFSPYYPIWIGGVNTGASYTVPDRLSPVACPEEVWREMKLFIMGVVKYEFQEGRKGSSKKGGKVVRVVTCDGITTGEALAKGTVTGKDATSAPPVEPLRPAEQPSESGTRRGGVSRRGRNVGPVGAPENGAEPRITGKEVEQHVQSQGRRGTPLHVVTGKEVDSPVKEVTMTTGNHKTTQVQTEVEPTTMALKRRGRPLGSKNKPKT